MLQTTDLNKRSTSAMAFEVTQKDCFSSGKIFCECLENVRAMSHLSTRPIRTSVARWLSRKPAKSRHEKLLDPAKNRVTNFQMKTA